MFNGIIETIGSVKQIANSNGILQFEIETPPSYLSSLAIGDSIAVNGVCLTLVSLHKNSFMTQVVPETLRCTTLDNIVQRDHVNLERSLSSTGRINGHYVQGHIDCTGQIIEIIEEQNAWIVKIRTQPSFTKYLVNKAYIAIDGMSITIIETNENDFSCTLIPHTRHCTIAKYYCVGKQVNLEIDIFAKYLEKFWRSTCNPILNVSI